jgi:phospholipid/cholesterol/gamma-HCH transport system permease protein
MQAFTDYLHTSAQATWWLLRSPFTAKGVSAHAVFDEMTAVGVRALPVTGLAAMFMGIVLAMQGAYQLGKFGALEWVADLVSVSIFREIGPLITAVVVIGRSGSAITAELGTMKVSEEIDALEVMGIDPARFLIAPRVMSMVIMVPCITVLSMCLGLFGGWLIAAFSLGLDSLVFVTRMIEALSLRDLYSGLIKSTVFGFLIGTIACHYGIKVQGGAEGVGRATTLSVVTGLSAVLTSDCLLTAFFYFL